MERSVLSYRHVTCGADLQKTVTAGADGYQQKKSKHRINEINGCPCLAISPSGFRVGTPVAESGQSESPHAHTVMA